MTKVLYIHHIVEELVNIQFENIGVVFEQDQIILKNVSFDIPHGTRVALIGQSGAGKSTLASLVRRDQDPTWGKITIDGYNLTELQLNSVLRYMGVILQRPEILSGTVRENITHSLPFETEVCDDQIWEIIDLVSPEMRKRFGSKGLNTRVGKQGLLLSGGEQQRLCVMRALIKNPHFLIVDEATSSLDSETEYIVQAGIDTALSRGISALVIAHRFSTLRNCNKFVVLRKYNSDTCADSQIEAVANSLPELFEISATFRSLAQKQGFQP